MGNLIIKIMFSIGIIIGGDAFIDDLFLTMSGLEKVTDEFGNSYFMINVIIKICAILVFLSGIYDFYKVMHPSDSSSIKEKPPVLFKDSRKLVVLSILKKSSTNSDNFMIKNYSVVNPNLDIANKNLINNYMDNDKSKSKIINNFAKNRVVEF